MSSQGQGPILIAGQTASGKSGLALKIATSLDAVIINADSMQVYADLQLLTARPSAEEMQGIPHHLYGHVAANAPYSVGSWLQQTKALLAQLQQQERTAVIVGGTGLYFKALLEGLSPVPQIADDIRKKWRQRADEQPQELHAQLAATDPQLAERLHPSDRQRLTRGLEVIEATGKSLLYWQQQPLTPVLPLPPRRMLVVSLERETLYQRCNARLRQMVELGALDEVQHLLDMDLDDCLPVMRALGVPPFAAHLRDELSLEEAIDRAQTETRQYAKRQMTWLRSNMITWKWLSAQDMLHFDRDTLPII